MNDPLARLQQLGDIDEDTMTRLHESLTTRAEHEHLLDISYRTLDTPVGMLLLAATERGLVRVAYDREDHDAVLEKLAAKVSPRILRAPKRLDPVAHELEEYFAGGRRAFDVPLDLRLAHGFRLGVLRHLSEIGYGHTESYSVVAGAAGNPRAVRAVGSACATNPLPVVVPCHRVVRSDGSLGGYVGGLPAKELLLGLERGAA
ncbi:MAG: methylated-DNA--[protein]-cysteine S-methyltransferase [Marmoricola sp.]